MANIHPTALVDPAAELDGDVQVGAYAIIGPHVRIGAGTRVGPHVVIEGRTTIGRDNRIWQFCSLGGEPQDKKYAGEPTELVIGDRNTIREFCTFSTGTAQDGGVTRVGDDNWVMAYVHLAHDVQLGNRTTLANNATLAGHVHVGDWVTIGGLCGVHQFVKIGAHAMIGFQSAVTQDVPPYMLVDGNPLPNAPKWTANLTARYSIPLASGDEVYVYTDWAYRSKVNFFLYEATEFTGKALTEGGLRVGYLWGNGKYEAAGFVRNITNQIRVTGAIDFNNLTGFINEPRTYGVQFKANF